VAKQLANINDGDCSSFPRLTQDGKVLLFVHCARGKQKVGLWVTTRNSANDDFRRPTELESIVNAETVSHSPALASDEQTLYYSMRSPGNSVQDFDLWSVTRVRI
jgi:Tol biopolymer transport system component